MPAFEYKVESLLTDAPLPLVEEMLTDYGARRWELVSTVPNTQGPHVTRFYFKRAVATPERESASK